MHTFDFVPFTGGVSVKIDGDDGNDIPAGLYKIITVGQYVNILEIPTAQVIHQLDMNVDTATLNGGAAIAGATPTLKATAVRDVLRTVFFKAGLSTATTPETIAGIDATKAVTPAGLTGWWANLAAPKGFLQTLYPSPVVALSTTIYNNFGAFTNSATEAARQLPMPISGTLKNLYIVVNGTQPADGALTITVRINGVDTGIVVTIPAGTVSANQTFSDTTHTAAITAGQKISLKLVNASPTASSTALLMSSLGVF